MNINDPNKGGVPPEDAKDANTRDHMQIIGQAVSELLPDKWGFFVMAFPFDHAKGRMNYVASASREDVIKLMREFIKRNGGRDLGGHK
jgi:hypothetical protein